MKTVKVWQRLPELPGHEVGWVERPHEYEKATRQLAIRWLNKKKWQYCVLAFNLTDLMLFQLAGLLMPRRFTEQDLFSAIMKAYNLRSGGVETSIKNSKQGLGLNKRNKKRFQAQQMLILLAQLAYNITVWVRNQLAQHSSLIASFGMLRMIRDAFRISGKVQFDEKGNIVLIVLNQSHQLAKAFQETWQFCFPRNDLSLILGKICVRPNFRVIVRPSLRSSFKISQIYARRYIRVVHPKHRLMCIIWELWMVFFSEHESELYTWNN